MSITEKLADIQKALKVKKEKQGTVQYKFRSNEKILEALKPLLKGAVVVQNDELVQVGSRYYVKSTTRLIEGDESIESVAYAREEEMSKVGLNQAQITGSCSSYSRKYSICGLLAIDDSATDPDAISANDTVYPKRSEINGILKEMEDIEEFTKYANSFIHTYGKDCFDRLSGHKKELLKDLFSSHKKRILKQNPFDANATPQSELEKMITECSSFEEINPIIDHMDEHKLHNDENTEALLGLQSEYLK